MPQSLPSGQQTFARGQSSRDQYIIAGQSHNNSDDSEEDDEEEEEEEEESTSEEDSDNGDGDSRSRRVTTAPTTNDRYFAAPPRSYTFPAANNTQTAIQTQPRQITTALVSGRNTAQNTYQQMQKPSASSSKAPESAYGSKSETALSTGLVVEINTTYGAISGSTYRFVLVGTWNLYLVALPLTNGRAQPTRGVHGLYTRPAIAYASADGKPRNTRDTDNLLVILLDSRAAREPQSLTINFGEPHYIDPATQRRRLGVVPDVSNLTTTFHASQRFRFNLESRQQVLAQTGQVAIAPSNRPSMQPEETSTWADESD